MKIFKLVQTNRISCSILLLSLVTPSFESMITEQNNQTHLHHHSHNHLQNETSGPGSGSGGIYPRSSPPTKSLFSSQIFNAEKFLNAGNSIGTVGGLLKTLGGGGSPFPLRESYIAYEQAHPGPPSSSTDSGYSYGTTGQNFDEYFKPSKFPLDLGGPDGGFDFGAKLQNSYSSYYGYQPQPHSQYKPYYYPLPPPPPPPQRSQPFLRLVKIPGDLKVTVTGGGGRNDMEVSCEFPPYLLIVQQVYWHFIPQPSSFLPPYGTFYDLRNGFAPRVTVTPVSKWKSILRIRDYTPDDFGTYRCVSTAILPDEPEPRPTFSSPPYSPYASPPAPPPHFLNFPHDSIELRSSESNIDAETSLEGGGSGGEKSSSIYDLLASSSKKQERRVRFLDRSKREVGVFGVYAPFFKPHYGIYRVYKEIFFSNDAFGAGSDIHENTINTSKEKPERVVGPGTGSGSNASSNKIIHENGSKESKRNSRRFENSNAIFRRSSKVLFK